MQHPSYKNIQYHERVRGGGRRKDVYSAQASLPSPSFSLPPTSYLSLGTYKKDAGPVDEAIQAIAQVLLHI